MHISLIGCGWLGIPLLRDLKKEKYKLSATVRSTEKFATIENIGANVYNLDLDKGNNLMPTKESHFWQADVFIISIPPKNSENYVSGIRTLVNEIVSQKGRKWVIYTSSTGVYGNHNGLTDESVVPTPDRDSSKAVLEVEQVLKKEKKIDWTILRLAGLAGPGRMPGRFFAGKKNLSNADSPVNFVHLDDCIGVINTVIKKEVKNMVLNVCADEHPVHRIFYREQALKMGLEPPEYNEKETFIDKKIIDNRLLKDVCGYEFIYPNPMNFEY